MELSEAKETLKNIKRCCLDDEQYQKYGFMEQYIDTSDVEAIDTVLKALDNSISKEYHEMAIKEQNDIIEDLKSKLDNSISKDEVRKKIEILDYLQEDAIEENALEDARILEYKIKILQELLGE